MTILPAHYSIEGVCAACRGAIKSGHDRYRIGDREYHAHCFDISLWFPVARVDDGVAPLSDRPYMSTVNAIEA